MSNTGMPKNSSEFPNISPPKFNNMFNPLSNHDLDLDDNVNDASQAAKKGKKKKKKKINAPRPGDSIEEFRSSPKK